MSAPNLSTCVDCGKKVPAEEVNDGMILFDGSWVCQPCAEIGVAAGTIGELPTGEH
jgi:hypothetical protein